MKNDAVAMMTTTIVIITVAADMTRDPLRGTIVDGAGVETATATESIHDRHQYHPILHTQAHQDIPGANVTHHRLVHRQDAAISITLTPLNAMKNPKFQKKRNPPNQYLT